MSIDVFPSGNTHLYADREDAVLNETAVQSEYADMMVRRGNRLMDDWANGLQAVHPLSFGIDDVSHSLASIPLPFSYDDAYLSDWPEEYCEYAYRLEWVRWGNPLMNGINRKARPLPEYTGVRSHHTVQYATNPRAGTPLARLEQHLIVEWNSMLAGFISARMISRREKLKVFFCAFFYQEGRKWYNLCFPSEDSSSRDSDGVHTEEEVEGLIAVPRFYRPCVWKQAIKGGDEVRREEWMKRDLPHCRLRLSFDLIEHRECPSNTTTEPTSPIHWYRCVQALYKALSIIPSSGVLFHPLDS